jgi:hypothetical protein
MNLVFGSEVALLGFWEYMFRILFRVQTLVYTQKRPGAAQKHTCSTGAEQDLLDRHV